MTRRLGRSDIRILKKRVVYSCSRESRKKINKYSTVYYRGLDIVC